MIGRKGLSLFCAVTMVTGMLWMAIPTQAATVMYDEDGGEKLEDLLAEDTEAWPTLAVTRTADLKISAKGAVLMDQGSGAVLYEKDSHAHYPIASVTKVMTLLLVMEAIDEGRLSWEETVTCSATAASMGGSQIWLEVGEIMTVEELVKAAVVVSANDACAALAEHLCGTIPAFVECMNARAAQLNMTDTHFVDCSGLDDTGYSCAYDVAVMSRQLMTHSDIQRFTTIWMDTLRGGKSQLVNTNKLVRHYPGATGLKTGTTQASGHCLSATATKNGTSFVAVVLGCATTADRFNGARSMLDYGFSSYVSYQPSQAMPTFDPVSVKHGQKASVSVCVDSPESVLLKKGTESSVTSQYELAEDLYAPVLKGQQVGTWRLTVGEETVGEYPILAAEEVPKKTFRYAYTLLLNHLLA